MQRRISAREVKRQVQTQTEGLIIKSRDINENDTVVKILTGDLGLISAFAMERFFMCKINLHCWVKVKEGWRNREGLIHNFGLDNE